MTFWVASLLMAGDALSGVRAALARHEGQRWTLQLTASAANYLHARPVPVSKGTVVLRRRLRDWGRSQQVTEVLPGYRVDERLHSDSEMISANGRAYLFANLEQSLDPPVVEEVTSAGNMATPSEYEKSAIIGFIHYPPAFQLLDALEDGRLPDASEVIGGARCFVASSANAQGRYRAAVRESDGALAMIESLRTEEHLKDVKQELQAADAWRPQAKITKMSFLWIATAFAEAMPAKWRAVDEQAFVDFPSTVMTTEVVVARRVPEPGTRLEPLAKIKDGTPATMDGNATIAYEWRNGAVVKALPSATLKRLARAEFRSPDAGAAWRWWTASGLAVSAVAIAAAWKWGRR